MTAIEWLDEFANRLQTQRSAVVVTRMNMEKRGDRFEFAGFNIGIWTSHLVCTHRLVNID